MQQLSDAPSAPAARPVAWGWVVAGVVVGAVLLFALVPIVRNIPPRPDVAILVGCLAFALMGILVAFKSEGETIREAVLAGVFLGLVSLLGLRGILGAELRPAFSILGLVAGAALAGLGGWVGEVLQGTLDDGRREGLQWPWIWVGTLVGVVLSVYAVFLPSSAWGVGVIGTFLFFCASFFLAAFFVGYFSPGVTILEPAVASILIVVVDALLATLGFRAPFPLPIVAIGMLGAFVIALGGGYAGEVAHNLRFGEAWGDEEGVFREARRPE